MGVEQVGSESASYEEILYLVSAEFVDTKRFHNFRKDVELIRQVGHGSFGLVYAGLGRQIRSCNGITFG